MIEESENFEDPKKTVRSLSILAQESHLQPEDGEGEQPRPDLKHLQRVEMHPDRQLHVVNWIGGGIYCLASRRGDG